MFARSASVLVRNSCWPKAELNEFVVFLRERKQGAGQYREPMTMGHMGTERRVTVPFGG